MKKGTHYSVPQDYKIPIRMEIINRHVGEGKNFDEIGEMFGVGGKTILYHYNRYTLQRPPHSHAPILRAVRPIKVDPYTEYLKELGRAGLL